jgi:hypothetical protein
MTTELDEPLEMPRPPRRWLWPILLALLMFVAGIALTLYALRRSEPARRLAGLEQPAAVALSAPVTRRAPAATAAPVAALPADLAPRLARAEQGIAQLARRTTETSSNAERAEGLLVAFAARRALDRGTALGYIEGLLRERFGDRQPQAVATILSASRQPVTLEELQTGLDQIGPQLMARSADENWWQGFRRELAGLVVVRRASVPSVAPVDRLTRARRQLETGHVDLALVEVARLPGRAAAADWIVKARRYASARQALDTIETAALLAPHRPVLPAANPAGVPLAVETETEALN